MGLGQGETMKTHEGYEIIYEFEVGKLTKEQLYEDTPNAFRVCKCGDIASGVIVFGRHDIYRKFPEWIANPNCRELIAHLIRTTK